ncbi:hypothetical protein BDY17DRAFT_290446 [Neohortaea acidophila]|uniref:Uncharacterized protein n=1 Tax=Neohortaea acidophila TaxID=245834 RepID=A0A6A6Q7F5_9PEZI|nr:uncharacterized protein BDY17DRAFT_290446 [Neohortaea acidophila]KAF2488222.1 hypothetical protein BDY17DRAFT_290446 [Neohortaea acidophila]
MAETLDAFTFLLDTLPSLLEQLDAIVKSSEERQSAELCRQHHIPRPPSASSSQRSRGSEDEPRLRQRPRSPNNAATASSPSSSTSPHNLTSPARAQRHTRPPALHHQQLPPLTSSHPDDPPRTPQCKRKTRSACSARPSAGPLKYRSRTMVTVFYDGDIQQRFEAAVRTIAHCRNAMRKGKMSAKVDFLARCSSSSGDEESADDEAMPGLIIKPKRTSSPPHPLRSPRVLPRNEDTMAFDQADAFLDQAQALCERAAHQVLRNGDCTLELTRVKEKIAQAREVGQAALPMLQRRAVKAAQRQGREAARTTPPATEAVIPTPHRRVGSPESVLLEVDSLEVDDPEADDGDSAIPEMMIPSSKYPPRQHPALLRQRMSVS